MVHHPEVLVTKIVCHNFARDFKVKKFIYLSLYIRQTHGRFFLRGNTDMLLFSRVSCFKEVQMLS